MYFTKLFILIISIFLTTNKSHADWLCKEAASRAMDDTFYACGHSLDDSLMEARENSLKAAKREFDLFCNDSANCKEYAYNISPLRTDCTKEDTKYSCYRGLEYTILNQKKSSIRINKSDIAKQIRQKEKELAELEEDFVQIEKLESLDEKISKFKKADKVEAELVYLKHVARDYTTKKQGITIKVVGVGTPLKKDDTSEADSVFLGGLGLEYDLPIWRNVSLKTSLSYLFGREGTTLKDRGDANTQSETQYHSHKGIDLNVGLPILHEDFTFSPNVGYLTISYKSTQYNYNNFGVGLNTIDKNYQYNSAYAGLGVRYGKMLFIEVEPRHYFKDNKSALSASVGARFEF